MKCVTGSGINQYRVVLLVLLLIRCIYYFRHKSVSCLLTRFYSPNSGSITIDGIDINQFELTSLRAQIAFVDQNVRLFNDSIL